MTEDEEDVPIRVDFRNPATARTWIEETKDEEAARTGTDQRIWEATLTLALRLAPAFSCAAKRDLRLVNARRERRTR